MKKKGYFDLLITFFSHQGKDRNRGGLFLQHISHLHKYTYLAHPIDVFALPILQKLPIYRVLFFFGATPGVDSHSRHFGMINK